jgi:hypothetical protein
MQQTHEQAPAPAEGAREEAPEQAREQAGRIVAIRSGDPPRQG